MAKKNEELSAKIEGDVLVIRVPMHAEPVASQTGKTLVVATTHGNQVIPGLVVKGKPVKVGVNAFIPNR